MATNPHRAQGAGTQHIGHFFGVNPHNTHQGNMLLAVCFHDACNLNHRNTFVAVGMGQDFVGKSPEAAHIIGARQMPNESGQSGRRERSSAPKANEFFKRGHTQINLSENINPPSRRASTRLRLRKTPT